MTLSRWALGISCCAHALVVAVAIGVAVAGAGERVRVVYVEIERREPAEAARTVADAMPLEMVETVEPPEEPVEALAETEPAPAELSEVTEPVEAFAAPIPPQRLAPPERPARRAEDEAWLVKVLPPRHAERSAAPAVVTPAREAPAPEASTPSARVLEAIPGENPPPVYPPLARRRGWQGSVVVRVEVDGAGRVTRCEVLERSGHDVLDLAAAAAVRKWRFRGGPGSIEIPFEFVLR